MEPIVRGGDLITPVVPVLVGDDWQAVLFWKALYDAGVYTNVALYPAVPRGGALLRTVGHGHPRARPPRPRARDLRAGQGRGRGHVRARRGLSFRLRSRNARAFSTLPQASIRHQRPERFFDWS